MSPAFGSNCLALAVLAAAGGVLASVAAGRLGVGSLLRVGQWAIHAVSALLTLAGVTLVVAFLGDDFRLAYVAGYSERALPTGYKLAAFWAGQDGSLLLWAWLVAQFGSLAVATRRDDPPAHQAAFLAILAGVCGFFAAVLLFASNPFQLGSVVPPDGFGLNPQLQDPAMIAHPPALFAGYAGFTIPFALGLAALIAGRSDRKWLASARRWAVGSWLFLTVGIVLGSWWAYVELGWGGYWGWDPVENASLLPWLTGTALVHSLIVHQRRDMLKLWSILLTAGTFLLCIFAAYLTRSGVIASVHAFPESSVGWFYLAMLAAGAALSVGVVLWRRKLLASPRSIERALSLEAAIFALNVLAVLMMIGTLVGTIFPILSKPFLASPMTLEAGFYNTLVVPMGLVLAAMMAAGPVLATGGTTRQLLRLLIVPAIGVIHGLALSAALGGTNPWMLASAAVAGMGVFALTQDFIRGVMLRRQRKGGGAVLAAAGLLRDQARRYGGMLAHLGVAMVVLGVAGSSLYKIDKTFDLTAGQEAKIGRYTLRLESLDEVRGANYIAAEAKVTLRMPDGREKPLVPQRRQYNKSKQGNSEVAIRPGLREDVYLILAGWRDSAKVTSIQAIVYPLVSWIWIGGIVMTLGAIVCLVFARRQRSGGADVHIDAAPAAAREAAQ